jgi:1-acyl-sn-glycerol-3-phosphate acyltransferase
LHIVTPANGNGSTLIPATHSSSDRLATNGNGRNGHRIDYATLDYGNFSNAQRFARGLMRIFFAAGARVSVEDLHHLPKQGGFIIAANHLCLLDVPLLLTVMERPVVLLADDWLHKNRVTRWILGDLGNAIFVGGDGVGDEAALADSLTALRAGGIVGLSPEGAMSTTGALARARSGIAYLALQSGVPIIPVAAWGHERLTSSWKRFRRPQVTIRIGAPIALPPGDTSVPKLDQRTEMIMRALASLLPLEYRGAYA